MVVPVTLYRAKCRAGTPDEIASAGARVDDARGALFEAISELRLLAPRPVSQRAEGVPQYFDKYHRATLEGAPINDGQVEQLPAIRTRLYRAMRGLTLACRTDEAALADPAQSSI
jgi:hypothetical protein